MIAPSVEAIKAEIVHHAKACEEAMHVADALAADDSMPSDCRVIANSHSHAAFLLARRLPESAIGSKERCAMANAITESWSSPVTAAANKATGKIDILCGNTRISCHPDEAPTLAADLLAQFEAIQAAAAERRA